MSVTLNLNQARALLALALEAIISDTGRYVSINAHLSLIRTIRVYLSDTTSDATQTGDVVVTWAGDQIVLVSRQDEEGRILSVIAEAGKPPAGVKGLRLLTDEEVTAAYLAKPQWGVSDGVHLTVESGPYCIDKPTVVGRLVAKKLQRKFCEVNGLTLGVNATFPRIDCWKTETSETRTAGVRVHGEGQP